MTMDEIVARWLISYNSSPQISDEDFDGEMVEAMFNLSGEDKITLIERLAQNNLTPAAEGLLGAGLFEDLITEHPNLVEDIAEKIAKNQSLKKVLRHAWVTEEMSPTAKSLIMTVREQESIKF